MTPPEVAVILPEAALRVPTSKRGGVQRRVRRRG
jgi:hypothetical protein